MFRRVLLSALFVCSAGALAGPADVATAAAQADLPATVMTLMQAAGIPDDAIGAIVLRGNQLLLSHGAGQSMQPASTMKLVTTMVGLDQLGPVFRGRTELRTSADLIGGTLMGDLVLRGGADADFNEDALYHMLQTLRNQGIKKIKGDLIVDRQLFQPARADLGVAPFDESPEFYYNVIPDALLLNSNLLHIDLNSTGKRVKLVMTPALENVTIASDMTLVDAPCPKWEDGWKLPEAVHGAGGKLKVLLHGTFPRNCIAATSINVLDRADYADRLFRATWRRLGGTFTGQVREAPPTSGMAGSALTTRLLAQHVSRVLPEVLRDMNKSSDNMLARLLYLSLGSLETDPVLGSHPILFSVPENTAQHTEQVIRTWFQRHHIDDQGLVLENGSGLSRTERIRPLQMAAILQAASQSNWAPEFVTSLPIAAVDGTMRRRLAASPAAARARIKTGTLNGVVAIAGYVPDANGQQCIIVAIVNNEHAGHGAGKAVTDALIDWVANQGQTPAQ
ncbi:MAG TPA: D-alanyl-D-alanine carboxypeptidase/D-alanyl-D-alanine-endopeptidase [Janthinobacterium sp.]|nr:D-alanyl-D-alanine carboxypeptidase/D-alanyl-D-alanine-endopeptidase [Janthinobacterium sp.]